MCMQEGQLLHAQKPKSAQNHVPTGRVGSCIKPTVNHARKTTSAIHGSTEICVNAQNSKQCIDSPRNLCSLNSHTHVAAANTGGLQQLKLQLVSKMAPCAWHSKF